MVQNASMLFFQNVCEPKFPFVETNIFQELRNLSQDGNAMDHRLRSPVNGKRN